MNGFGGWMGLVDGWMGLVEEWLGTCACSDITCHLHFRQNDWHLLPATAALCLADGLLRLRQCRRLPGAAVQQLVLGRRSAPQTAPPGRRPPLPRRRVPPLPGPVPGAGAVVASLGLRRTSQKPAGLLPRAVHDRRRSRVCDGFCCFCYFSLIL